MPTFLRLSTQLVLSITLATAAFDHLGAQQTSASDSLRAVIPSIDAARAGTNAATPATVLPPHTAKQRRDRWPTVFYGALAGAAGVAVALHVDPDSGGYRDGWTTATDFPDKAVHGLAGWAITSIGVDLGARPRHAAVAVCAAGTAFEFAQGYVSPYDIAADCIGATGAALWQSWRARRRERATKSKAAQAALATQIVTPRAADPAAPPAATTSGKP